MTSLGAGLARRPQRAGPALGASRAAAVRAAAWCAALCIGLAACSGGGSTGSSARPSRPAPTSSTDPASGPAAVAAVKAMWQHFFDGTVPISARLPLLQNGQLFAPFVRSQAKTTIGSLILQASATVSSVTLQPPSQANVVFTILLAGKPLEKNLQGSAVYVGGHWKVAATSFCSLLRLAYGKKSHVLPAACGG